MKIPGVWTVLSLLFMVALAALPAAAAERPAIVMGDYDAELRAGEHVDIPRMVERLTELGVNTYMWLIWHSPNDWDDLKKFLPEAEKAGITVWAYLVPHSETAVQNPRFPYSEPFRLDYIRWAEEIARLSLKHPNLTGYVIDDFWYNTRPGRFTLDYVREMVQAGKAVNPKLRFYPLMYYGQIDEQFADAYAPLVDGVVAAYPKDREEIERALTVLNDEAVFPERFEIHYPPTTPSRPGDGAFAWQQVAVLDPSRASVSFRYQDTYNGPTAGYHVMRLLVDGQVAWEEDVAGADNGKATVDLSRFVQGKRRVRLALGVTDLKAVAEYAVRVRFSDLVVSGFEARSTDPGWERQVAGQFSMEFRPREGPRHRFRLPLIIMPAASRSEYKNRWNEEATPERIAARVRTALEVAAEGKAEGVVVYCLNKAAGSEDFDALKALYREFAAAR